MAVSLTVSVTDDTKIESVWVGERSAYSPDKGIVSLRMDGSSFSLWGSALQIRALSVQLAAAANELAETIARRDSGVEQLTLASVVAE